MVSQIDKGIFNYSVGSSSSVALGGDARGIEVVNEEKEFVSYETGEGDGHFALEGGRYHGRYPNPGAVIIAIDDVLAVDLGYSEVAKILSTGDKGVLSTEGRTSPSGRKILNSKIVVTLRETSSELWGSG